MPNKYAEKKEWKVPKQKYKLSNWSEYSDALRRSGEIDVWFGYRKRPYHCGMKRIGFMMEPVRQNVSAILQSSLAMKYVKYIVYPFAKQKALSIPCFGS